MATVLVIGAGVAGIKCSLELAERGFKVYLCDRNSTVGGTLVQLDSWFPDNHCRMCQLLPSFSRDDSSQFCLRRGLYHPNIEFLPLIEVRSVEGDAGDFRVTLKMNPKGVDETRCIGCGLCSQLCPVEVENEFEQGMTTRKAIYLRHPLAPPNSYVIDWENCNRCGVCVKNCPTNAVNLSAEAKERELEVGAIILATGFEEFDPRVWTQYGYRRYPNVITSTELERMLSYSGPYAGKLVRPSDGTPPKSLAFLQCVGSRTKERDYCSSVCCMYALKEAMLVKERNPQLDVHIFFMDMRSFGKGHYRYYERAKELGINFNRYRIPNLKQEPKSKNLILSTLREDGSIEKREFELVVLSVGQTPSPKLEELGHLLGIEQNRWGFVRTKEFSPSQTNREGIYACGSATGPKDIADAVAEAGVATCQASELLCSQHFLPLGPKTYPQEIDISEEKVRGAIFLCHCGEEISSVVNVEELSEFARGLSGVVYVEDFRYLCLEDGLDVLKKRIKEERINRVIIAACSASPYERLFIEAIREVGLNPSLLEVVDIRKLIASVHQDHQAATEKGKKMLASAWEKVKGQEPLPVNSQGVKNSALVIGAGLAGLTATLSLAQQGFNCHLVEKEAEVGGNLRHIYTTLNGGDPQELLQEITKKVKEDPHIYLHLETEVVKAWGHAGDFGATLKDKDGNTNFIKVGAIIISTGGQQYEPKEYLYGKSEKVITQRELERRLATGKLDKVFSVVMIQCVGSQDEERPYCSRVCCSQALKNALKLKQENPEIKIFICYRDVMAYGFREEYYSKAREKGVIFVRYELDHKPEVRIEGGRLLVEVNDSILNGKLRIEADLVVLSPAIVPSENRTLANILGVELNEDGFFQEAEVKFRPVEFIKEGIYVCGLAHSPRDIGETIVQAQAAAQQAATLLCQEHLKSGRVVSYTNERRCSGCGLCMSVCPYDARIKDEEKGVVVVIESLCQGCGICVATCPNGAAKLKSFTERQILSMVDAII